jgi:hypothetical protein
MLSDIYSFDITSLPQELFLMVLNHLDPQDAIRCRRVSKAWNTAFKDPRNLILLLKRAFPRAREVRKLVEDEHTRNNYHPALTYNGNYWKYVFDLVTARYFHLACGRPQSAQNFKLYSKSWFPVQAWDSHDSHFTERVDFAFDQATWTYEDGIVIFPSFENEDESGRLVLFDLGTEEKYLVPFPIGDKVIRGIRLREKVLIIEWAEPAAFHWLNDSDGVHRHFATAFDIFKTEHESGWDIIFRNEWKIMFLGHPLSERDRFFSAHGKHYYAIYAWQPNRSLYTADEDAPIESLFVWDISEPSPYKPSLDPTGRAREAIAGYMGPAIVARYTYRELGFFGVRQRGSPAMVRLGIDSEAQAVVFTENFSVIHNGLPTNTDWSSRVLATSIPFITLGPCWRHDVDASYPPYRGNSSMESSPLVGRFNWYTSVCAATDSEAGVSYSLDFSGLQLSRESLLLTIRTPNSMATMNYHRSVELSFKGKVCGDERFVFGENERDELVVYRF